MEPISFPLLHTYTSNMYEIVAPWSELSKLATSFQLSTTMQDALNGLQGSDVEWCVGL